jgi:hypothetical protein
MMKNIFTLLCLLACINSLQAQTKEIDSQLTYTNKDYWAYMQSNRSYVGFYVNYNFKNLTGAAHSDWVHNYQDAGAGIRIMYYPLLFDCNVGVGESGERVSSPFSIPAFQQENKKHLGRLSISLSVCPLPYIPLLKRTQEYIVPYVGIGYQWDSFNSHYNRVNLSAWYYKVGCEIFLNKNIPCSLFFEYNHTLNPDKIRNMESFRIGFNFRYSDMFKFSFKKNTVCKPFINPE